MLTKAKYNQFVTKMREEIEDDEVVEKTLTLLREVLRFDPAATVEKVTYNEKRAEYIRNYRQRQKEKGVSLYVSSGAKASYYKKKAAAESANAAAIPT